MTWIWEGLHVRTRLGEKAWKCQGESLPSISGGWYHRLPKVEAALLVTDEIQLEDVWESKYPSSGEDRLSNYI